MHKPLAYATWGVANFFFCYRQQGNNKPAAHEYIQQKNPLLQVDFSVVYTMGVIELIYQASNNTTI